MTGAAKPLAGVRVLELARILAGPWAGQTLADLGAEVIKVERPGAGDDTRRWGPPFVRGPDGEDLGAAYFHATNRGKRSIEADLQSEEGRRLVVELAKVSDVLIENFKVGDLKRRGLDYESLKAVNPRLVYCSITGFGQDGPYAGQAGYDFLVQGMGGIMDLTGEADGPPVKIGVAFADIFTGVYASTAVLAALHRRERTGEGAFIDMALLDVQVGVLANQAMNYLASGRAPGRMGSAHPNIVPYQVFQAVDGPLIVATGNDEQFRRLCEVLGLPELGADPDYAANADRVKRRDSLVPRLAEAVRRRAKGELAAALQAAGVPAGPINDLAEVFADPQVVHRGMRLDLDGIPGVAGPVVMDGRRMVSDRPSPSLGADGDAVLKLLDQES